MSFLSGKSIAASLRHVFIILRGPDVKVHPTVRRKAPTLSGPQNTVVLYPYRQGNKSADENRHQQINPATVPVPKRIQRKDKMQQRKDTGGQRDFKPFKNGCLGRRRGGQRDDPENTIKSQNDGDLNIQ